jgi:hypothetical protein
MSSTTTCPACYASLVTEARYCHRCGRALAGHGTAERGPWLIAWGLVALALGGIVYFVLTANTGQERPDMANTGAPGPAAGAGAPPDINKMCPRARFLRLNDRIMSAWTGNDTAMALRFAPMAVQAYGMLDEYDPDVRYHAGEIMLRMGQVAKALALADTIQSEVKDHLFGDMLRAEAAQAKGDRELLERSRRAFLAHYPAQMASGRPEYQEHRGMLDEFRKQAQP